MNDPNGLVYLDGEYHLFYQFYPDSTVWGPMHWGHAISGDLVHWEDLPIALYPDSLGYIFSGSAVVDHDNTSGLGTDSIAPLVAIFTHHSVDKERAGALDVESQSIAYSTDRGRTWTKYAGNPVLPNTESLRDFRDPKIIWHEGSNQWVMSLAAGNYIIFYGSNNLLDWQYLSDFGQELGLHKGVWECPDLFPLTVAETSEQKWVLLVSIGDGAPNGGSGTQYFVGDFDGTNFKIDRDFRTFVSGGQGRWVDYGRDNYAGVTFSNIPEADGRRIFIGWMSNWWYAQTVPTQNWRSAMTLPRSLTLHESSKGYSLHSAAIGEVDSLLGPPRELGAGDTIRPNDIAPARPAQTSRTISAPTLASEATLVGEVRINAVFARNDNFGIELFNGVGDVLRVGLIANRNAFYSDRRRASDNDFVGNFAGGVSYGPRELEELTVTFRVIIDAGSVELFGDDGGVVLTETFFPTEPFTGLRFFGMDDGSVELKKATFAPLRSIWATAKR